jgi:hypothetical protein
LAEQGRVRRSLKRKELYVVPARTGTYRQLAGIVVNTQLGTLKTKRTERPLMAETSRSRRSIGYGIS